MTYIDMTRTGFDHWSYIGLRAKYLRLLKLPKWKNRLGQIEAMDEFDRLEAVCEAQLDVANSRLQRTQGKQDLKAKGREKGPLATRSNGVAADDNIKDDATLGNPAQEEVGDAGIDDTAAPQQKPQGKRKYVFSGKYVGKYK